jgi:3-hydroxybutyrate dehydrogenase
MARGDAKEIGMFLKGKTALVTGSTSGIGLAYAKALAGAGAAVMINGFGDANAIAAMCRDLAATSGAAAVHDPADMTDPQAIGAMVKRCHDELGGPDIIVNNAGIQHVAPVTDFPPEKWDAIIAINLSSAFHVMRASVPHMRAAGWGRIISTASAHSLVASPNKAAYVAAKHGLVGLTKTLALEGAPHGITVNAICPGYVHTPIIDAQIGDQMKAHGMSREDVITKVMLAKQAIKEFVAPDAVAETALFLASEAAATITGIALPVDGGWTAQ